MVVDLGVQTVIGTIIRVIYQGVVSNCFKSFDPSLPSVLGGDRRNQLDRQHSIENFHGGNRTKDVDTRREK